MTRRMTDFAFNVFYDALNAQGRSILRVQLVRPAVVAIAILPVTALHFLPRADGLSPVPSPDGGAL